MKVSLNKDEEVVKTVKEGLKRTGGYCKEQRITSVCAKNSKNR